MKENYKEKNWLLESESEKKENLKMSGHILLKTLGKDGTEGLNALWRYLYPWELRIPVPLVKRKGKSFSGDKAIDQIPEK